MRPPSTFPGATERDRHPGRLGGLLGIGSLLVAITFVCWMFTLTSGVSIFALVIGGLVAAPYLLIWLACRSLRFWVARLVIVVALVGCCLLGIYAFSTVDDDAQGGLNLVFGPIYQLIGVFVLLTLAAVIDHVWKRHSAGSLLKQDVETAG